MNTPAHAEHRLIRLDPTHSTQLAAYNTKADMIRHACRVLSTDGEVTTGQVRDWLHRYGIDTVRQSTSTVVNQWRTTTTIGTGTDAEGPVPVSADDTEQTVTGDPDTSTASGVVEPSETVVPDVSPDSDSGRVSDDAPPVPVTDGAMLEVSAPTHRTASEAVPYAVFGAGVVVKAPPGAVGFYAVSVMSLFVSLDTSWRFFGDRLHIDSVPERAVMFAVIEAALVACGYGMAAGVRRHGHPGPARIVAWALCGLAAYAALVLAGPVGGLWRALGGPALGLVMLHLALGIEVRARRAASTTTWARIGREIRERVLSRLGLADDHRDAVHRTRDRAAFRVAKLSLGHRVWFRQTRLQRALLAANVADDPAQRSRMLNRLAVVRAAHQLAVLEQPSPWATPTPDVSGS